MRRALLLINSNSRHGDDNIAPILEVLEKGDLQLITPPDDQATDMLRSIAERGPDCDLVIGGGMAITADASIDDGTFDLLLMAPQPMWSLVGKLPIFRWGRHDLNESVVHLHGREIRLTTTESMPISTDGEITPETPAVFQRLPKALEMFVPQWRGHLIDFAFGRDRNALATQGQEENDRSISTVRELHDAAIPTRDRIPGKIQVRSSKALERL